MFLLSTLLEVVSGFWDSLSLFLVAWHETFRAKCRRVIGLLSRESWDGFGSNGLLFLRGVVEAMVVVVVVEGERLAIAS